MKIRPATLLLAIAIYSQFVYAQKSTESINSKMIIIGGETPPGYSKESIEITRTPADKIGYKSPETQVIVQKILNGTVNFKLFAAKPVLVYGPFWGSGQFIAYVLEPGDSVYVHYKGSEAVFSGLGDKKCQLVYKLQKIKDSIESLPIHRGISHVNVAVTSLDDYWKWDAFLNKQLELMELLIDSYKEQISSFAYNFIKERTLCEIENIRVSKFNSLRARSKLFQLSNEQLCNIYDSTLNGVGARWLQYEAPIVGDPWYLYHILELDFYRQRGKFFKANETDSAFLGEGADPYVTFYNMAKLKYKGLIREEVLAFIFWNTMGVLRKVGFEPKVEEILADYYGRSGYAEYRRYVKQYEALQRERYSMKGSAPDFTLWDAKGHAFSKAQLKGKVAVLDFWFTGCVGCVQMVPALHKVEEAFENDTNVVFLSISIDEDRETWTRSVAQGKYTTGNGLNFYTGGEGKKHQMIKNYFVDGYPSLHVLDYRGEIVQQHSSTDPRKDSGRSLIELIRKQLVQMKDGPYVLHKQDSTIAYFIDGICFTKQRFKKQSMPAFNVQTDEYGRSFRVILKDSLSPEPAEYAKPEELFVLSDIEGNFDAFRKLLQVNGIIDENCNWMFGNGHLVFSGDMFDRGKQVTECLWLVYSLEEQAKAAGGYVHYILGNHEIMNIQGNHKYVQQKYKDNANLIGRSLKELYNEYSELGRWLRTKNIVEKIGDILFVHGGIKKEVAELPLSVSEMNQLARPYYAATGFDSSRTELLTLFNSGTSPFWMRGYYIGKLVSKGQLDSTLQRYNVSRIVTGHTIVADTVSIHYDGKVINTDTKHAEGKSEALLIMKSDYYRVNADGKRVLLFSNKSKEQDYNYTLSN